MPQSHLASKRDYLDQVGHAYARRHLDLLGLLQAANAFPKGVLTPFDQIAVIRTSKGNKSRLGPTCTEQALHLTTFDEYRPQRAESRFAKTVVTR